VIVRLRYFYILLPFLGVRKGILTAKRQYESTGGNSHSSSAYYNVILWHKGFPRESHVGSTLTQGIPVNEQL